MRAFLAFSVAASAMAAPAYGAKPAQGDEDGKVICKSERFVGSNRSQRVCMTRAEWDHLRRKAKDYLDHGRNSAEVKAPPGGTE